MAKFYMMVGVPGSGKSYIANHRLKGTVVSSDAIRAELYGSEDDQDHNGEVFNELHKRIHALLNEGKDAIYDATNLSRKRRKNFLKELPAGVEKIAVIAATELDVILRQNSERTRVVPEEVIMRMFKQMSLPRLDEGWDNIMLLAHDANKKTLGEYLYDAHGVDHDNPHHSANIFEHMLEAGSYANTHADEAGLTKDEKHLARMAALFHDIGKPLVKSRMKMNGQMDDKSHYYNHAEIGTYMMACCANQFTSKMHETLLAMIILTQWHMEFFANTNSGGEKDDNTGDVLERFEALYGERMRKVFELVHEADLNAH